MRRTAWLLVVILVGLGFLQRGATTHAQVSPTSTPSPTSTVTALPTATPTVVPSPTAVPISFHIRSSRVEGPHGAGLDWHLRKAPLHRSDVNQQVVLSLYVEIDSAPKGTSIYSNSSVYLRNHRTFEGSFSGKWDPAKGDGRSYTIPWTPRQAGRFRVVQNIAVGGMKKAKTIYFTVQKPFAPRLHIQPASVHVGQAVHIWTTSPRWPRGTRVSVTWSSAHHAWSGTGSWTPSCGCFAAHVYVMPKIHGREQASVVVAVHGEGKTFRLRGAFWIQGNSAPKPKPRPKPTARPPSEPVYSCIPTEDDDDNDDKGLPAASWDHDGC